MNTTDPKPTARTHARFPKTYRLRNPGEFQAVYKSGTRKVSRSFVAFLLPNDGKVTRFGLTTSRKLGKAHDRNRIRRRVREILRREYSRFPEGQDIVLNPRRSVLARDQGALRAELMSLLQT